MFNEAVLKIMNENKDKFTIPTVLYGLIISKKNIGSHFEYSIKILNVDKQPEANYPVIPKIKDSIGYNEGDIAIITLMYGSISEVQILKKAIL